MSYTVGNWTIETQIVDSISDPKTLSIPDIAFGADFAKASSGTADEQTFINNTSLSLIPAERIRFGRSSVSNVYAQNKEIPATLRDEIIAGVRTLAETNYYLVATNSVSGKVVYLPMRGWTVLQIPQSPLITSEALLELLKRTIAVNFGTGSTNGDLVTGLARGDLDPVS